MRFAFVDFLKRSEMGHNPKAQLKWTGKAVKVLGPSLLQIKVRPGTRGRFEFQIDIAKPMGASLRVDGERKRSGHETRFQDWLYTWRMTLRRSKPSSDLEKRFEIPFALSKHALIRLVQRANICAADELMEAVSLSWPVLSLAEETTREARRSYAGDHWLVPATIPTMSQPVVFAIAGASPGDHDFLFYAKSVLSLEMLKPSDRANVLALHEHLTTYGVEDALRDALRGATESLFEKTLIRR
jgi:hypothetical protein